MTETLSAAIDAKIRASFARQSLMATFGAALAEIAPGRVTITAPVLDLARQQHGFAHAALAFAIGDTAAGYAALSLMEREAEVVTAEMKINLLAPAVGDRLIATGRVVRAGRKLVVVTADVEAMTNGQGKLVALLQGTMVPVAEG